MSASPGTVDPHFSRAQVARNILLHMYESLVTIDENSSPSLQLADTMEISEDGLVYTFKLREGVKFHDGGELSSADVLASWQRWGRVSPERGRLAIVADMEAPDAETFVVTLKRATPPFVDHIMSPASPMSIMPASDGETEANGHSSTGTGPFRFVEYDSAIHTRMARFEEYAADGRYEGRSGYGGNRTAYFDTVTIRVIPEGSARVAGLQAGELHIVDDIPVPAANRLARDDRFQIIDRLPLWAQLLSVNVSQPPTDSLLVRQAIQAALNMEEIMTIATEDNFRLNHSMLYPGHDYYPGDLNIELYNQADMDKARALLEEAGYAGEELVILTNSEYASMENVAIVVAETLQDIGMNVRLDVYDWPTSNTRRDDRTTHNLFSSAYAIQPFLGPFGFEKMLGSADNYSFYDEDSVMADAWERILTSPDLPSRQAAWADIETRMYEQVYQIKLGDAGVKQAAVANLRNFVPYDAIRAWDVWFE
jgi:peptide/nickel transport system substrate-binding protein